MSEMINAADQVGVTMTPKETTLAESLRFLLTSMKLFGMYFRRQTKVGDSSTRKCHVQWNAYFIYAAVLAVFYCINALRMFSVFTKNCR